MKLMNYSQFTQLEKKIKCNMTWGLVLVNITIKIWSTQKFKRITHPTLIWCRIKGWMQSHISKYQGGFLDIG